MFTEEKVGWKGVEWDGDRTGGCKRKKGRRLKGSHFKTKVLLKKNQEIDPTHQAHVRVEPEFLREFLVMLMSWEILKYSFTLSRNKILASDSSDSPILESPILWFTTAFPTFFKHVLTYIIGRIGGTNEHLSFQNINNFCLEKKKKNKEYAHKEINRVKKEKR